MNFSYSHALSLNHVVVSSPSINIEPGYLNCCITCSVAVTSSALGCVALLFSKTTLELLTTTVERNRKQASCIKVTEEGRYSLGIFEWKEDSSMGMEPVLVTNVTISRNNITKESMYKLLHYFVGTCMYINSNCIP